MFKKQMIVRMLAILLSITLAVLVFIFDRYIINFLSQFKTTQTLLQYSDFWNHRLHDWLGDTITLVGVMLAFSLPFTAQVVQWVVSTYGVNSFPEIIKDKLQINRLLKEMFIFVGVVIFWRVFIYDISPYSASLYILFNIFILIYFVWILVKLFKVINYILKCTFNFQEFVIETAYKHIENTSNAIPTPYSEITDMSKIPTLNADYLQHLELLRDYEISKFKRGDIDISEKQTFDHYVWLYILALFSTNDLNQLKQAIALQKKFSTSTVRMCAVYNNGNYVRYIKLANRLANDSFLNRYYTLDERLTDTQENTYYPFNNIFHDMIFLAENIESKKINDYCPVLSCSYLLNHSSSRYSFVLPKNIEPEFDWKTIFERINKWENEIIAVTKRLIEIASRYSKSSALEKVYDNLKNDLQFSHLRQFDLLRTNGLSVYKEYEQIEKLNNINNENEIVKYFELLSSDEFNHKLGFSLDEKNKNLIKLLRIRYKFKVDKLILFLLSHLSFDTSIIIKILEKASPIDQPKVMDIGEHLIPTTIEQAFKLYLSANDSKYNDFIQFSDSDNYQIVFNTMILYFLVKKMRHKNSDDNLDDEHLASDIAQTIYSFDKLTIRNIKSISEIATLGAKQLKGIESNQGIKDLCVNYGISFDELKNLYTNVLACLKDQSENVIDKKIAKTPIDQNAITVFYNGLKDSAQTLLDSHTPKEYINNADEEKLYELLSINREWFIQADTGTYYDRKGLVRIFYEKFENHFKLNEGKTMIIFDEKIEPTVNFGYEEVELNLSFNYRCNFYFK